MIRRQLEDQLHAYVRGTLDDSATREIESLLENDAAARALFDEIRESHDALSMLRDRPTPNAPLENIQLAIASTVFAGRPEPDMHAWGNRFYKRVAAAAVLLCGLSLGVAVHSSLNGPADGAENGQATTNAPRKTRTVRERNVDVTGEITALELMKQNNGALVTFTPTDSVEPTYEHAGGEHAGGGTVVGKPR